MNCGGPGVGAIGMCVTGGFALAMALETMSVNAAVAGERVLNTPLLLR